MSLINLPSTAETKKLDAIRAKRSSICAELKALPRLPLTEAEVRAREQRALESLRYRHPIPSLDIAGSPRETPDAPAQRVLALVLELIGEQRVLDVLVSAEGKRRPFGKLSTEARAARERELREKLRAIEIDEEREVCRLEDLGFSVVRRADVEARLVVQVWTELYGDEGTIDGAAA